MDLVRLSAASGIALAALLALVSTARQSAAQSPLLELPSGTPQDRIEDVFRTAGGRSLFSLSGLLSPGPTPNIPVLPHHRVTRRFSSWTVPTSAWSACIDEAAQRFGIPSEWVRGVIMVESNGRTLLDGRPITSSAGAMGLMQVMPGTFAEMSARYGLGSDPYDPRANILAGTVATDPRTSSRPTMQGRGASMLTCATVDRCLPRPSATRRRCCRGSSPVQSRRQCIRRRWCRTSPAPTRSARSPAPRPGPRRCARVTPLRHRCSPFRPRVPRRRPRHPIGSRMNAYS